MVLHLIFLTTPTLTNLPVHLPRFFTFSFEKPFKVEQETVYNLDRNMKVHNFNAGPSVLPNEVLYKASKALIDFEGSGMSILEIGHRTEPFMAVMEEARNLTRELMQLDDDFEVLFLQGGATMQFMQVPMNLLDSGETASYIDTGVWSNKAIKEAKLVCELTIVVRLNALARLAELQTVG